MVFGFLKGLFSSGGGAPETAPAESFEYKGYTMQPAPMKDDGGWRVAGVITRGDGEEQQRHDFVRADVVPAPDQAVEITSNKARRLIDEQGERIFQSRS